MRILTLHAFLAIFLGLSTDLSAQFGNEWIRFNQRYFKILTARDGIYRITYDQMQLAGIPLNSVLPSRYKIYHRGREQSIFVSSQTDTPLQPGDFIEFLGCRNDGTLDRDLYTVPDAQPHSHYNLYSDTTAFFLTWDPAGTGKRMDFSNLFNVDNLPAEPFHIEKTDTILFSDYSAGRVYPQGQTNAETRLSVFDYGEGWTGPRILKGQFRDYVLAGHENMMTSGTLPRILLVLAGRNNRPHNIEILVGSGIASLRSLGQFGFDYYNNLTVNQDLDVNDFAANGQITVRINVVGFPEIPADAVSVSYLEVSSPQSWDMAGQQQKYFYLPANPGGTSVAVIDNPPPSARIYDVTDPTDPIRIGYTLSSGSMSAVIPNSEIERVLYVTSVSLPSTRLEPVSFRSLGQEGSNYLIISHGSLMGPGGGFSNVIQEYGNYRSSPQGGGFKTLIVDVQEIIDQFNYGEISPRAIHKFLEYMWSAGQIEYAFLIGKALTVEHNFHRQGSPEGTTLQDLVPTAGFPGSDILFSAGLGNTTFQPAIPTGRLIAQSPEEVVAYLSKVKEMETLPYQELWRKHLLHLSGGLTSSEVNRFLGYVNGYKTVAEGDYMGGNVFTKSKEGNSNRELINVSDIVNDGVSLITFYGHSAPNLTDIEIGNVSDPSLGYANKGKYCTILVNGCNAGNIFSTAASFGQDWILTPELGAISYLAHSATGFEAGLNQYSRIFYQVAFGDSTLQFITVGKVQAETSSRFLGQYPNSETNISQVQQVVLQGDPAVGLFSAEKPDFQIGDTDLFIEGFDDAKVTATVDSFKVGMVIRDFGRTNPEPLEISISRTANNGELTQEDTMFFEAVKYLDTLYFTLRNEGATGFGLNRLEVTLDPVDRVAELNEFNNRAMLNVVIPLGGTSNLFPSDFGIVSQPSVSLIAQTFDLRSEPRDFSFEMDTTRSFNSPFKQATAREATVLGSWDVQLLEQDSLVYYWRTRFQNPVAEEDTTWTTSSFTYIQGASAGWSQRHYQQMELNSFNGMAINQGTRDLEYGITSSLLDITTHGSTNSLSDPANSILAINGQNLIVGQPTNRLCRDDAIAAVAFDKSSTIAYAVLFNSGFDVLDPERCGITPQVINSLRNVDIEGPAARLSAFLDRVPEDDYVLLFSIGEVTFENWSAPLIDQLGTVGASSGSLSSLTNGEPWILLGRKGSDPGTAMEARADPQSLEPVTDQQVSLTATIQGRNSEGSMQTGLVGPARSWSRFDQVLTSSDIPLADQNEVQVTGVNLNGGKMVLDPAFQGNSLDLSQFDAEAFPYLQLRLSTQDTLNLTPADLRFWQVTYEEAPEGILLDLPASQVVQEGVETEAAFKFQNISTVEFEDSILVKYSIFNHESRITETDTLWLEPLNASQTASFDIPIHTLGRAGQNDLMVNVNPLIQIEQDYGNNVVNMSEYILVKPDESNPLLDVTFDGRYIMDGEIVSPNPLILIKVIDDNQVLLKSDTAGMDIMLRAPCENCDYQKISFTDPAVTWSPAGVDSDFSVEYQPTDLIDGVYTLKVQATDASGNVAGLNPYTIKFEVINESQITNFYPYPNPFSTSTRFVFTLTGAEIPDEIKIQIMTVSGIVVREITQDEIGPLRIGNNLTEYAWDGKDEYGDQLANGVYLYRVFVQSQGQLLERRETSADKAFKKGFGKLYLLR